MYFSYYTYIHFCFILTLKSSQAKIVNIFFSTRNLYISDENTSKYCSPIIVVHVHGTGCFLKFIQRVTILQAVSNQERTLERLISILWIAQKLYVGALSNLCEMYKLFIQQCGRRYPSTSP